MLDRSYRSETLITVYRERGPREEVMHDVVRIRPQSDGLELIALMGESRSC
jgi:predicted RNA-binding protein